MQSHEQASILLVDDHPANLIALEAVLAPLGQRMVHARSGQEALRHLLLEDFACILLDVQMPGLDGFETARLIKGAERTRHVPILFLTAISRDEAHIVRGYTEGAVDYIVKPFNPDFLRAKVKVFVDLHKRERRIGALEAEARRREHRTLEAARVGGWEWDLASKRLSWSPNLSQLLGVRTAPPNTFEEFLSLIHTEDRSRVETAIRAAVRESGTYYVEHRRLWADGSVRWFASQGSILLDGNTPARLAGIVMDISERKAVEAALLESEERLRHVLEAARAGVWELNLSTGRSVADTVAMRLFGISPGAPLSASVLTQAALEEDRERVSRAMAAALTGEGGGLYRVEYRTQPPHDGRERWIEVRGQVSWDGQGKPVRFLGTVLDVTERRQAEEDRKRLVGDLQEAVKLRDEFLTVASHELRTPLTPLTIRASRLRRMLSEPFEEGETLQRAAKQIQAIETQALKLAEMMDGLLDVSRLAYGKLALRVEEADLGIIIRETAEGMQPAAENVGSSLEIETDTPLRGHFDVVRLSQLVTNLLSNAIKFGAGKPISLKLVRRGDRARLTVKDNGIGIPENALERVFDKFERAVPEENYGGLGLGLWLTREIVQAMGGTIHVESAPDAGATFVVDMPLNAPLSHSHPNPVQAASGSSGHPSE